MSVLAQLQASVHPYGRHGQLVVVDSDDPLLDSDPPLLQRIDPDVLTRPELDAAASIMGITGSAYANKEQLVAALRDVAPEPPLDDEQPDPGGE